MERSADPVPGIVVIALGWSFGTWERRKGAGAAGTPNSRLCTGWIILHRPILQTDGPFLTCGMWRGQRLEALLFCNEK